MNYIAYGPVPSRRLGQSLGINNIPHKVCSYSCVYCQLGRTTEMQKERDTFYPLDEILSAVEDKVGKAKERKQAIDYLTFVSDGEPTLDINLGREIELLRPLGIKIAVITNSSLIWHEDVRADLMKADWVSLKIDSIQEEVWRKINRPYGELQLASILDGILKFVKDFKGELAVETMLVEGINDDDDHLRENASFLARLWRAKAYLSVPVRPPSEKWVKSPGEEVINLAFQIFSKKVDQVEYLIGYEGNAFSFTGNAKKDLLSITAVHPMREDAVRELLDSTSTDWKIVRRMIADNQLIEIEYKGKKFYMRRFHKEKNADCRYSYDS